MDRWKYREGVKEGRCGRKKVGGLGKRKEMKEGQFVGTVTNVKRKTKQAVREPKKKVVSGKSKKRSRENIDLRSKEVGNGAERQQRK